MRLLVGDKAIREHQYMCNEVTLVVDYTDETGTHYPSLLILTQETDFTISVDKRHETKAIEKKTCSPDMVYAIPTHL